MIKPELTTIAHSILMDFYQSVEPIETLIPIKGGEWSAAYKFYNENQPFVIRLSHTPENFFRDRVAAQWSTQNLPVPQIIKIDQYKDQHYAISPFYCGEALEKLSASELAQTIPGFLLMMTAMQSIDLSTVAGFGSLTPDGQGTYQSWSEALLDVANDHPESLTHGWKKILAEDQKAKRMFDHFYNILTELVQYCPEHKNLIHNDLLYQNLLVDNHRISAVIDWGCAMIGDPLYDIATFAFFEPWYPVFTQVNLIERMQQSYIEQSLNRRNFSQRLTACQIHLALGNIAYCAFSDGKHDLYQHINRLEELFRVAY